MAFVRTDVRVTPVWRRVLGTGSADDIGSDDMGAVLGIGSDDVGAVADMGAVADPAEDIGAAEIANSEAVEPALVSRTEFGTADLDPPTESTSTEREIIGDPAPFPV